MQRYLFLVLSIILIGCGHYPRVPSVHTESWAPSPEPFQQEPFKFITQDKMQAAKHWKAFAKDFTVYLGTVMENRPNDPNILYISNYDKSSFGKSFHNLLLSELKDRGFTISLCEEGNIKINWEVQVIEHKAVRKTKTLSATKSVPHQEVVITAYGIIHDNYYLASYTDIFYINELDYDQYFFEIDPPNKLYKLVNKSTEIDNNE